MEERSEMAKAMRPIVRAWCAVGAYSDAAQLLVSGRGSAEEFTSNRLAMPSTASTHLCKTKDTHKCDGKAKPQ
jgi:hypothetical protein